MAAGAEVAAFVATSEATASAAAAGLRQFAGIEAPAYLTLETMLSEQRLDALAILSPPETHAHALRIACDAGLHVLCEKPFVWGGDDPVAESAVLLERFRHQGLLVFENCQWPYTLTAFEALHPGSRSRPCTRFTMELEPITRGIQSLIDAVPHPLSLLQALNPGEARLEDLSFSTRDPSAESLTARFCYRTDAGPCDVEISLRQNPEPPRHAAYAVNGVRAERVVSPESYRLSFHDSDRVVPLADPLTQLVADFVAALREPGEHTHPGRRIQQRMHFLAEITAVYATEETR